MPAKKSPKVEEEVPVPEPTPTAIETALGLRAALEVEVRALEGDNVDAVKHAVSAVIGCLDSVEDALQTNERLVRV